MRLLMLFMAALCAMTCAWATDLIPVSYGTVVWVQATDERWVIPSEMYSTVRGFQGWNSDWTIRCDTLCTAVAVWERPVGPLSFAWADTRFTDWTERMWNSDTSGPSAVDEIYYGAKKNQSSPLLDQWEAGRPMTYDSLRWYYYANGYPKDLDWHAVKRPWYRSRGEIIQLHRWMLSHPDFRYLVVHFYLAPRPGFSDDTLKVDPTIYGCSRTFWASDTTDLRYPPRIDPSPYYVVSPDTNDQGEFVLGSFHVNTGMGGANLADGTYDVQVRDFAGNTVGNPQTFSKIATGDFFLLFSKAERALQPEYVEFSQNGHVTAKAILGGYETGGRLRFASEGGAR